MQKHTRQELERAGFTFHPGHIDGHVFFFTQQQTTADLSDLIISEYQLVEGGIMEPPKSSGVKTLLGLGLLAAGIWIAGRYFGQPILGRSIVKE